MNDTQRSQIRDNANYLRQVRPIDPEEIHEYVEGQPHPAAVRQVLREDAADLGLLERDDGTFEPVSDDPVDVTLDIERFPDRLARKLEDLLVAEFGRGWPDNESGDRLRASIRDFKRQYLHGGDVTYDRPTALGYGIYHLPSYYAAIQYVLAELADDELLSGHLRVLDVGAGVGGPALGLDAALPDDALVEYHAVEPSEAGAVLKELLETTSRNFRYSIHRETIESFEPEGTYDIILCANVLSELADPVAVLSGLLDSLAVDGTVLGIAPADRNTATTLREIERTMERETAASVYGPTVRLWPDEHSESECWSFDRKPALEAPAFQQRLDDGDRGDGGETRTEEERRPGDGEFVNTDVQYAYSLLRTDGQRSIDFRPDIGRFAKMAEMEQHVTDRIDCVAVKLSHDLAEGDNTLFLLGDGSEKQDHFAVLTEPTTLNQDVETADYGDLLVFENVLVLWNDDEQAYNLVVDGQTIVDSVAR